MSRWFAHYGLAEVHPGLFVGAYPLDAADVTELARLGMNRVLNLTQDAEYEPGARATVERAYRDTGIAETRLPSEDFGDLAPAWLEQATTTVANWLAAGDRVYLHCRAGWQRSAAVAVGVVALRDGVELGPALDAVRSRKPTANPLSHQLTGLVEWWAGRTDAATRR